MRRWPWITIAMAALLAVSPFGQDLIYGAFLSGEQLSRSISQFLLAITAAIVAGLALIEGIIKWLLARRRLKRGSSESPKAVPAGSNTET